MLDYPAFESDRVRQKASEVRVQADKLASEGRFSEASFRLSEAMDAEAHADLLSEIEQFNYENSDPFFNPVQENIDES